MRRGADAGSLAACRHCFCWQCKHVYVDHVNIVFVFTFHAFLWLLAATLSHAGPLARPLPTASSSGPANQRDGNLYVAQKICFFDPMNIYLIA